MSAVLTKVANDWTQLTDQEKVDLLEAAEESFPTGAELEALGKFRVVSTYPYTGAYVLNVIPNDKLVLPKELFGQLFETIDSITITQTESGNGIVRYVITDDLEKYYTWDTTNNEFVEIQTLNVANVLQDGMEAQTLNSLTAANIATFFDNNKGIGIGFALSLDASTDKAAIDNMAMQVDMRGTWKKAVHGTDYNYEYVTNTQLLVSLLTDGTYKINYPVGGHIV